MKADEILAKILEDKKKAEDARIEEAASVIEKYLETHPDGKPDTPVEDLDELLKYLHALNYLEKVAGERKKAADADMLLTAIRDISEDVEEEIDDSRAV